MSSSSSFAPDHHHLSSSSPEKLCYVHCSCCDTILAVSVPCACLFKTVTVRCGHCTNLLSVNTSLLLSSNQIHLGHSFFTPHNLLEEIRYLPSNLLINQQNPNAPFLPVREIDELPTPPGAKRPPEKRQRVPSAYNRFIKDEIQRIKAGNPDISHREAFSAAAKNSDFKLWRNVMENSIEDEVEDDSTPLEQVIQKEAIAVSTILYNFLLQFEKGAP